MDRSAVSAGDRDRRSGGTPPSHCPYPQWDWPCMEPRQSPSARLLEPSEEKGQPDIHPLIILPLRLVSPTTQERFKVKVTRLMWTTVLSIDRPLLNVSSCEMDGRALDSWGQREVEKGRLFLSHGWKRFHIQNV